MIRKLLPVLAMLLATVGGLLAGEALRPVPPVPPESGAEAAEKAATAYYAFPTQFFVPVMRGGNLDGTMVLSLSVEMPEDAEAAVLRDKLRLRDALLRRLLILSNTGAFDGNFTTEPRMRRIRTELLEAAQAVSDNAIANVLIEDIARQDRL
ncbi:hypothetical protein [Paracoccus sp. SCSIO 75233]|uniref:hypothetical protein n=1 Tax=Paracoccus sp. SCSIO 75233 TaxID=3017782 RepID=UPI0022F10BB5|nr:hypothetical protein [Paracoccus sp. SCSIO 75233]WBU53457.1 hypothetical protein PAF12_01045 [Paracoccus sp. SCSIO 75233]